MTKPSPDHRHNAEVRVGRNEKLRPMVMSNEDRRRARSHQAVEVFGRQAEAALDALALLDFAWHDCYGESSPPDRVIDDVWTVAKGDLGRFISAAHLAVIDSRDLRMNADATT